ncbi:MAG: HPF/RaiA family ribosome-associated protein [Flavobacterium sp.]|nr:HPF/RaiA family ribosome-associated protein [Flavobacterium sp.]
MNTTIQSVGFSATNSLTSFTEKKVEKIFKQYPDAIRIDVSFKIGASKNIENKWCSLYLSHKGENQFVKRKSDSFENSLLQCVEAMEKILRRLTTKKVNQRNDPPRK